MGGDTLPDAQAWTGGQEPLPQAEPGGGAGSGLQTAPFVSVSVNRLSQGGTQISWELVSSFSEPTPWNFTLQWGRSGTESWTNVATVTDTFVATDSSRRSYSSVLDGHYRVKLGTAVGNIYYSKPTNFPSTWDKRDLRICDELRRQSNLRKKTSGLKCWILYRKWWGTKCSTCIDETTGEVTDPSCTTCYGTGIVGGYHDPYPTRCIFAGSQKAIQEQGSFVQAGAGILVSFTPVISEHDLVILEGTDKRYNISKVGTEVSWKGTVLVQQLTLTELDPSDVINEITWGGTHDPEKEELAIW